VITAVDAEIVDAFASAYADVERHFEHLIGMLFPGGSGRLSLSCFLVRSFPKPSVALLPDGRGRSRPR
jgi:hypothetical protein